jgi:hypothetical protein
MTKNQFNQNSRTLLKSEVQIHKGEDENRHLEQQLLETVETLPNLARNFKHFNSRLEKGEKVSWRKFKVGKEEYETVSFNTGAPEGFVFLPNDSGLIALADFYRTVMSNKDEFEFKISDAKAYLQKFLSELKQANETEDVTAKFADDLEKSFTISLSPICAAAKDEAAFAKLMDNFRLWQPEAYHVIAEHLGTHNQLAEKVENCAREILAERLEDKLCNAEETKSPFLTKLKAIIGELPYISAMTLTPAIIPALAAACDSSAHHMEPNLNEHLSEKPASGESWEKINDDKFSGAFFSDIIVYDSQNDKTIGMKSIEINTPVDIYTYVWAFDSKAKTWENKSDPATVPTADTYAWATTYDSQSSKILVLAGSGLPTNVWVYDYARNNWSRESKPPSTLTDLCFSYDSKCDKVIALEKAGSIGPNRKTIVYDYNTNSFTSKSSEIHFSTTPVKLCEGVYDANSDKTIMFVSEGGVLKVCTYDYNSDQWEIKLNTGTEPSGMTELKAVYDSSNKQVLAQIYKSSGNSFETWTYDCTNNEWTKLAPSGQISISKPLGEWPGVVYDSSNGKVITTISYDPVYIGGTSGTLIGYNSKEVWSYNASSQPPPTPEGKPTFVLSADEQLLPVTPVKISNPAAGDDYNVVNNLNNYEMNAGLFKAPDGKPILFNKKVSTMENDYEFFFFYWTDNPSNIPLLSHQHDWEYVAYKYDKSGNLLDTRLSNHLETRKAASGVEIYIEQGGHALTTKKGEMWNPIPNLPRHFKDGGQRFTSADYYIVNLDPIVDSNAVDSFGRYKADEPTHYSYGGLNEQYFNTLPAEQKAIAQERAKAPWLQDILQNPEQTFADKDSKQVIALFELEANNLDLDFRVIGSSVTGEDNGTEKSEIPQASYQKLSANEKAICLYTTKDKYPNYKVEVYAVRDTTYNVKVYVECDSACNVKEYSKSIKMGEIQVISAPIPQPEKEKQGSSPTLTIAGAAIGTGTALGVAAYLFHRRRKGNKPTVASSPQPKPNSEN